MGLVPPLPFSGRIPFKGFALVWSLICFLLIASLLLVIHFHHPHNPIFFIHNNLEAAEREQREEELRAWLRGEPMGVLGTLVHVVVSLFVVSGALGVAVKLVTPL